MSEWRYETLAVTCTEDVLRVHLNRPDVRNAFNETMIAELTDAFTRAATADGLRAVVLGGEGRIFCAGADIDWMRRSVDRPREDNVADARRLAEMYTRIDECPAPVIGRIQRAAFGGAVGLAAVCDITLAEAGTRFCFSEVRLGIIPAVISRFVLERIGAAQARRYFLTAEVFTAEDAPPGLVHEVVPEGGLDARIETLIAALRDCGPAAVRAAKALIAAVRQRERAEAIDYSAEVIAAIRVTPEAQAGLRAFLERENPPWQYDQPKGET